MMGPEQERTNPEVVAEINSVGKIYGKKKVVTGIDLTVFRAEIFGLLGPSGAGKTTLVRMIAGIDRADEGEIRLAGERMPKLSMLRRIGYMAQSDALYAELTGRENMEFFASLYGIKGERLKRRIEEAAALVHLTDDLKKQVSNYSGGMKRRLSLAIALLHEPDILILDEPTVGIDPVLRQSVWHELARLSRQGTTILVTTHVMDEAYRCHRLGMIREGSLIACGTPGELMAETGSATIEEAFLYYGGVRA
jgi:ABC-2 type transport system ATP-binding protein